jgi:hypothetical protein
MAQTSGGAFWPFSHAWGARLPSIFPHLAFNAYLLSFQ